MSRALSAEEVRGLREELAAGGTPTVWFTASAVGVPAGRSGKVIALDEPAEGDFIQVRPAGSKDVLSFSAGEVTLVKPPRKRKEPAGSAAGAAGSTAGTAPAKAASPASTAGPSASAAAAGSAKTGSAGSAAKPGAAGGSVAKSGSAGASSAGARSTAAKPGGDSAKPGPAGAQSGGTGTAAKEGGSSAAAAKPAGGAKRKPRSPAGASVVLTADAEGQWNVEVSNGKKRVLKPMPVAASAVAQAARSLHEDVAAAVEPLLAAAREQQRERVEQLQRELADAQRMLDELTE